MIYDKNQRYRFVADDPGSEKEFKVVDSLLTEDEYEKVQCHWSAIRVYMSAIRGEEVLEEFKDVEVAGYKLCINGRAIEREYERYEINDG